MIDTSWFQRKWGIHEPPIELLYKKIQELEDRIKVLEEENISTTNSIYEIANSLEARIDMIAEEIYTSKHKQNGEF
jgi:predicted  nucleic acid-binding Zn-ribbon protein